MLGDECMIAPVVEQNARGRHVYLPEDMLLVRFRSGDDYTVQTMQKGHHWLDVPMNEVPLFIRRGHVIPLCRSAEYVDALDTTKLSLVGWLEVGCAFTLYEDDGHTNDYRKGAYLKTKIAVKAGVKTVVTFTNEGSYETAVESMYLDMIHREKSPFYVQVDGKELPHFLHRRKFEEAESGWYYSQRLKSVQVKYPNPKKDHEVMVSFEQFDLIGM
jgi:alpha-glucosidase